MNKSEVVWARPARPPGLYFAPGYNPATRLAELWKTDGATCTRVWADPTGGNLTITGLAHSTATGLLYVFLADFGAAGVRDFAVRVSTLDPRTDALADFAGPYQFGEGLWFGVDHPAVHAAEYGGALYVAHQGGRAPLAAYATRLDLGSGAVSLVAQASGDAPIDNGAGQFQPDFTGGMGVVGDTLYWTDGVGLWSGTGGALGFDAYLGYPDPTFDILPQYDVDGFGACGSPVSNPLDGAWYIPGQYAGDETPPTYGYSSNKGIDRQIRRHDLSVELDAPGSDGGAAFYSRIAAMTVLYAADDATPVALYALDDGLGTGGNCYVWRRDPSTGAWAAEIDLQAAFDANLRGVSCSMKSWKGVLYVLGTVQARVGVPARTILLRRDPSGSWATLRSFDGYTPGGVGTPTLAPVARVSATIPCHRM